MPILGGNTTLINKTALDADVTLEDSLRVLHNHENFIKCNPNNVSYNPLTTRQPHPVPEMLSHKVIGPSSMYTVTDKVPALPAGIWDRDILSTYEFSNLTDGLFVRVYCPLSVKMEATWTIQEVNGRLEMVETNVIICSRLLAGIMRSQCEFNYPGFHGRLHELMK